MIIDAMDGIRMFLSPSSATGNLTKLLAHVIGGTLPPASSRNRLWIDPEHAPQGNPDGIRNFEMVGTNFSAGVCTGFSVGVTVNAATETRSPGGIWLRASTALLVVGLHATWAEEFL
jgi:hypothetical protein